MFNVKFMLELEDTLKTMNNSVISFDNLVKKHRNIPKNTIKEILTYLDKINKIIVTEKGICWIDNKNKYLSECISRGLEL